MAFGKIIWSLFSISIIISSLRNLEMKNIEGQIEKELKRCHGFINIYF